MGMKNSAAVLILLLVAGPSAHAGREATDWDVLPDFNEINFTTASVGFADPGGVYFVFDREARAFSRVPEKEYRRLMPVSAGPARKAGADGAVLLQASDGTVLEAGDAYCSEGVDQKHWLKLGGEPLKDHVRPCVSVSAAEMTDGRLWLGTRGDGEYGERPASGIVVQSAADGSLIKTISDKEGLSGNLVRVIRADPFSRRVWSATHLGLSELSAAGEVLSSWYLYEDLDGNGLPAVMLSTAPRRTNFLAVLQRKLGPKDPAAFVEAVRKIPPEIRDCLGPDGRRWDCRYGGSAGGDRFLPEEFNVLVPFVVEAADFSPDNVWMTYFRLCMFGDKGVAGLLAEKYVDAAVATRTGSLATQCLYDYRQAGLLKEKPPEATVKAALGRVSRALARLNALGPDGGHMEIFEAHGVAVEGADALAEIGSPKGIELLNRYFIRSKGGVNDPDALMFDGAAQTLHHRDDFLPGAMAGIEKFYGAPIVQGCMFLDLTYPDGTKKNRLGAAQLRSLVIAVENASHPEYIPHQPSQAEGAYSACRQAALSQMKVPSVREEFYRSVYPALSPAQRKTADLLAAGLPL
ncbi:MAG: hypothetical protein FD189_310 [Elusimicrobia bacterium]|nr:MAG: hypothetical protein FD154_110 [Elusimicrobiota bacterium]KAF0158043.1 MAG: hypothetical protein FD189_310 [Elusimicrobiota bacterium]